MLLATHAAAFDEANKESILAWVTGFGAAVSMISNPLFGAVSDRTTSSFGRRGVGIAFATGILALCPTWTAAIIAAGIPHELTSLR